MERGFLLTFLTIPFTMGGREAVGGSPRGQVFPESLLNEVLSRLENNRREE
jgi:hypothetical protein